MFWQCFEIIVCILRKSPVCFRDLKYLCMYSKAFLIFFFFFAFVFDRMHVLSNGRIAKQYVRTQGIALVLYVLSRVKTKTEITFIYHLNSPEGMHLENQVTCEKCLCHAENTIIAHNSCFLLAILIISVIYDPYFSYHV